MKASKEFIALNRKEIKIGLPEKNRPFRIMKAEFLLDYPMLYSTIDDNWWFVNSTLVENRSLPEVKLVNLFLARYSGGGDFFVIPQVLDDSRLCASIETLVHTSMQITTWFKYLPPTQENPNHEFALSTYKANLLPYTFWKDIRYLLQPSIYNRSITTINDYYSVMNPQH